MSDSAITTDGLTRRFGTTLAVDGLSFEVHKGEVFGFLGHNGAGKTTTVRLLNGVLKPDSGDAQVLGYSPITQGNDLRAHTGVLTETPSLDERLSATENLTIYANLYGVPENEVSGRVTQMLETFDLSDRATEKVGGYSKGMKQRLALARSFLHQPDLLFLDEPTSGLDPVSSRQVHEMIQTISRDQGRTVFLCTHNLVEAQKLCDRVAVMQQGKMVAIGSPAELAQSIGHGVRYMIEINETESAQAQSIVQELAGVKQVEQDSHPTPHLILTLDSRDIMPHAIAALVNANIAVYSATAQEMSLEDIYFALQSNH